MPLCSRRAWTTCQGPVDPSRLTTYPPPVATTTASSFHVFNQISRPEDGGVIIITTIHTQRPTSSYVYQFYPGKPRAIVPLLSRHSHHGPEQVRAAAWPVGEPRLEEVVGARCLTNSVASIFWSSTNWATCPWTDVAPTCSSSW